MSRALTFANDMNLQSDNEKTIIAYLLGELPEEELQRFERRYLEEESLFQELQEIEDELIDDYVTGALSAERRTAFEQYFLRSPERRDKVEFARAITERARAWKKSGQAEASRNVSLNAQGTNEPGVSTEEQTKVLPFKRWQRPVPAWRQWAAIAAAVLFAVAGVGLWLKASHLQRELLTAQEQQTALLQNDAHLRTGAAELQSELSAEQKKSQTLEEKIEQIENLASADTGSRVIYGIRLGIEYLSGGSRGEGTGKTKTLEIPRKAQLVRLGVEFGKSDFQTFKATLRRADRSVIWTRGGLKARSAGTNQSVRLVIPADSLPAGDYDLVVSGVTPEGNTESVGRYYLRVVRR